MVRLDVGDPAHLQWVIESVVEQGENVNATDEQIGTSALWLACEGEDMEGARVPLECGADINKASFNGDTPLDCATYNPDLYHLLKDRGAKLSWELQQGD